MSNDDNELDSAAIAERLRLARQIAGYSQEGAARKLKVSVKTVGRWERGETLQGLLRELRRVTDAYGVTPEQILGPRFGMAENGGASPEDGDVHAQIAALTAEVRELRELLLDQERLRARGRGLVDEEG